MTSRRATLAVVTSTFVVGTIGGAAMACSHSYGAADAPADATTDVTQPIDDAIAADVVASRDDASDAPATPGPTVLASGYAALTSVAADEMNVYFSEQGTGGVHAVPIGGGIPNDLAPAGAPTAIAINGGFVYWTDVASGSVGRVSTSGGMATTTKSSGTPTDIAVTTERVLALSLNGSVGSGQIEQFALDLTGDPAGTITSLVNPFSIAARGATMYWTEGAPSNAVASALVGSTTRTALTTDPDAESIATDASGAVYWSNPSAGLIKTRAAADGAIRTVVTMEVSPRSVAVDDSGVYWLTTNGLLRHKRLDQELPPETLASGFMTPLRLQARGVALTSTYAVWITEDGRVLRVTK